MGSGTKQCALEFNDAARRHEIILNWSSVLDGTATVTYADDSDCIVDSQA